MKVLVIGLPGSGKSTYCKEHLGASGLCFDLDALAAAFRLRDPHEEDHQAAHVLANAMLPDFLSKVKTSDVYIIRAAPSIAELKMIAPDQVIMCREQFVYRQLRGISFADFTVRLEALEEYCNLNKIPVKEV